MEVEVSYSHLKFVALIFDSSHGDKFLMLTGIAMPHILPAFFLLILPLYSLPFFSFVHCCEQSLNRILEHQHVMQKLNTGMTGLEIQCVNQSRQITVLTSALAAAAAADLVEKK